MSTVKKIISSLLIGALMATVGNAFQHSQTERIRFRKFSKETLDWLTKEKEVLRIGLGILPLDRDTVLLFGSLHTFAAPVGTLMLRSEDGGRSWTEVMAPIPGSSIWEVVHTGGGLLWALVVWTTESPGEVTLYKSEDRGKTWKRVAGVPKRYYNGQPDNLTFADDKHGLVEMYYGEDAGAEHEGVWTMETRDGGRTWREKERVTLADLERRRQKAKESEDSSSGAVSGRDGSEWRIVEEGERMEDERVHIRRRLPGEVSWSTIRTIARYFEVSGGEVIERQVKR
jgi:hypothetical protein